MDDKILEAFTFGTLQDCANMKLKLDEHGISWEEFLAWMEMEVNRVAGTKSKVPPVPRTLLKRKCPGCEKQWLRLEEVNNNNPGLQVGGDYKCQWYCPYCSWAEYSVKDIITESQPYIEEIK